MGRQRFNLCKTSAHLSPGSGTKKPGNARPLQYSSNEDKQVVEKFSGECESRQESAKKRSVHAST